MSTGMTSSITLKLNTIFTSLTPNLKINKFSNSSIKFLLKLERSPHLPKYNKKMTILNHLPVGNMKDKGSNKMMTLITWMMTINMKKTTKIMKRNQNLQWITTNKTTLTNPHYRLPLLLQKHYKNPQSLHLKIKTLSWLTVKKNMMKTMKRSKDKPTGILISTKMLILILYDNQNISKKIFNSIRNSSGLQTMIVHLF